MTQARASAVRQVEDLPALPLAFALESGGVLFEAHDTPFPGLEFERSSTPPDESEAEMKCGPVDDAHPTHRVRRAILNGTAFGG